MISKPASSNRFIKVLDLEDFVPESRAEMSNYICYLCKGVIINPVADHCGHIFCKSCIETSLESWNLCPVGTQMINASELYPIKFVESLLEKQSLYCKNRVSGCPWIGKFHSLESHMFLDCSKQIVNCDNYRNGCKEKLLREDMKTHLLDCAFRLIKCKNNCSDQADINPKNEAVHLLTCPRERVRCPSNCGDMIERKDITSHIDNSCDNTMVPCLYEKYGCHSQMKRKDLVVHLKENETMHSAALLKILHDVKSEIVCRLDSVGMIYDKVEKKIEDVDYHMKLLGKKTQASENYNTPPTKSSRGDDNDDVTEVESKEMDQIKVIKKKTTQQQIKEVKQFNIATTNSKKCEIKKKSTQEIALNRLMKNIECQMKKEKTNCNSSSTVCDEFKFDKCTHQDISIKGLTATLKPVRSSKEKFHRFALLDISLNDQHLKWKITLSHVQGWMAWGVANKQKVTEPGYLFAAVNGKGQRHGAFLISSNGYTWNNNELDEDNQQVMSSLKADCIDCVILEYQHEQKVLKYALFKSKTCIVSGALNNVRSNKELSPCILFLREGDEIKVEKL